MSTTVTRRYRLDDLRKFAVALASPSGLLPARAQALASQLLWFDAIGAANLGIATLPNWLAAIEGGRVDPRVNGQVRSERAALAVLDGQQGIPPLILERGAALAVEKAREMGAAWVRVTNVDRTGSAAAVAAGIATGPFVCFAAGPGGLFSLALPAPDGLPVVVDGALCNSRSNGRRAPKAPRAARAGRDAVASLPAPVAEMARWARVVTPDGDWLIAALAVAEIEPLATFHERVVAALLVPDAEPGLLTPTSWEARRREVRERGLVIAPPAWRKLAHWAQRLGVELPEPGNGS